MSKPCNTDQLKSVLERIIGSTDALDNEVLKSFIFRLKNIPSLPSLYEEVTKELRSKTPSASRLSGIISQDMAMTAKLLQMVNNPVYCVDASVSSASQAVLLLGVETIQAMALSLGMFSAIDPQVLSPHKARHLWEHSIVMGKLSTLIAKAEGVAATDLGVYQSAGLLHDIGKLVMASANPSEYRMIENLAISTGTDQCKMESQTAGHNHAEVGACLLNLWGLPSPIVEATAWHHNPSASSVNKFSPLAAVHVANALHATMSPEFKHWDAELDLVFLERIGLANRQEIWMKLLREQFADGRSGDLSVPTVTPVNRRFS
jgi:putative nucleotidyltransferase with HDIG domain